MITNELCVGKACDYVLGKKMAHVFIGKIAVLAQDVRSVVMVLRVFRVLALQSTCASCVWARVVTNDPEVGNALEWVVKE